MSTRILVQEIDSVQGDGNAFTYGTLMMVRSVTCGQGVTCLSSEVLPFLQAGSGLQQAAH